MDKEKITSLFKAKGVDVGKLLFWLQQPKQGIMPQLAMLIIKEVAQELDEGKEWYKESLFYPEEWRKQMEKRSFPESFWLENYVLERCRLSQENLTLTIESQNTAPQFNGFIALLKDIKNKTYLFEKRIVSEIQINSKENKNNISALQYNFDDIKIQIETIKSYLNNMIQKTIMSSVVSSKNTENMIARKILHSQKEREKASELIQKEMSVMNMGLNMAIGEQKTQLEENKVEVKEGVSALQKEITNQFNQYVVLISEYKKYQDQKLNELETRLTELSTSQQADKVWNMNAINNINRNLTELLKRRTFFGFISDVFRRIFGHGRRP